MATKSEKFAAALGGLPTKKAVVSDRKLALQDIMEGQRPEYRYIKLDNITLNPLNDYAQMDTAEEINQLAQDIKRNGLLHNIVVSYHTDGGYLLLSGERRLKAYKMLREENPEKYSEIYALVRKELSEIDEKIILDAANLQTRGTGSGGEAKYRKAMVRFIENLQNKFDISQKEAQFLAKEYSGASQSTVERNVIIENKLSPYLQNLLDTGVLSKVAAVSFSHLNNGEQQHLESQYKLCSKDSEVIQEFTALVLSSIKENLPITTVKAPIKKEKRTVDTGIKASYQKHLQAVKKLIKAVDTLEKNTSQIIRLEKDFKTAYGQEESSVKEEIELLYQKVKQLKENLNG